MRRVVVTGLGVVSPLGVGTAHNFRELVEGRSGIRALVSFDVSDLPCKIAGQVPRVSASGLPSPAAFDPERVASKQEARRYEDFILFALCAADEALAESGWRPESEHDAERSGVLIGSGIGGFAGIADTAVRLHEGGPRKVSPYFIPGSLINEASGVVSIRHNFKGPNHAVVTACATGAHAIGDAARLIAFGDADVMLAGGTEAATCRLSIAGFAIMRALSTSFNDTPEAASRPWDRARDGFVMGEGAGMVVLEEFEHARKRGATIYAELLGYGLSGDAYHLSSPDPSGGGARRAMAAALGHAKISIDDVDYLNAHATSTPVGDPVELRALAELRRSNRSALSVSATKSATGHLLGAAGAVEAIFSLLALKRGVIPPTLNLSDPDVDTEFDLVPLQAREKRLRYVMSNSFGFGGTNASLVLGKV
jgi:3-oxoacyl-[acyl-carrier-protein] synthase II